MLAVALHRELLEMGGKALQVLLMGQHGYGLSAEGYYQIASSPIRTGRFRSKGAECSSLA